MIGDPPMPETILVTGASGTVGREVVRQLLALGVRVRASGRAPSGPEFLGLADYTVFDFENPKTAPLAFRDVRSTFLLTPLDERMVGLACGVVEQAKAAGVEHIVRLSAMGTGDIALTELARVHRAVEQHIETSGLKYTFLRPNAFMQNYLTAFGESIRRHGLMAMPQGHGAVSVVDARDVAAVAVAALRDVRHHGHSYDLTGPESLTNNDIAQILSNVLDRSIRYVDTPEAEARKTLLDQGISRWLVTVLLELYAISREGMAARVSSAIQEVLGRPPISFRQFATDYAEHFR